MAAYRGTLVCYMAVLRQLFQYSQVRPRVVLDWYSSAVEVSSPQRKLRCTVQKGTSYSSRR